MNARQAGLGLAAMLPGTALAASNPVADFDRALLALAAALRTEALDELFIVLTGLGSILLLLPLALALSLHAVRRQRRSGPALWFVPAAVAGAALFAAGGKLLIGRPRPELFPAVLELPADPSFPSAHAMQATAFALAWLLRPGTKTTPTMVLVAVAMVAAVGLSRVYLQVHFPSDVLAGCVAGVLWVLLLRAILPERGAAQ